MENNIENKTLNSGNLTKKERKMLRRKEKEEAKQKEGRKNTVRKISSSLVAIFILSAAVLAVAAFIIKTSPQGDDQSVAYEDQGRSHIAVGGLHPPYNSNPPTSGWHYANPARIDAYREELPDEQIVHNLEHGDIWISYRPETVSAEIIERLENFAGSKVLVTPRGANDRDVALSAWGRLDKFDIGDAGLDEARIETFISRYRNRGPERVAPINSGQ